MDQLMQASKFTKNMVSKVYTWDFIQLYCVKQWLWLHTLEFIKLYGENVINMNLNKNFLCNKN